MSMFTRIERLMAMDEAVWSRHANPWSVYTRMPILPLLALAVWSRVWIGWWALLPVAALLAWTWLNPRLFPPPGSLDGWASGAVLGERIYLGRDPHPVRAGQRRAGVLLSLLGAAGLPFLAWGLVILDPWLTAFGAAVSTIAKLWFCDRMVWLHRETMAGDTVTGAQPGRSG